MTTHPIAQITMLYKASPITITSCPPRWFLCLHASSKLKPKKHSFPTTYFPKALFSQFCLSHHYPQTTNLGTHIYYFLKRKSGVGSSSNSIHTHSSIIIIPKLTVCPDWLWGMSVNYYMAPAFIRYLQCSWPSGQSIIIALQGRYDHCPTFIPLDSERFSFLS